MPDSLNDLLTTPLIQINSLSRSFGTQTAVNNINFELNKGEILGFLGPNGAGKSTTMSMITGNLAPSAGSILIKGIDLLEDPIACKKLIGYCPETPPLYKELTVFEFLKYCAKLHGVSKHKINNSIQSTTEKCGLSDVQHRLIRNLSKGYQQRVAIAQAIIHEPEIIILDEPTVGLDPIQIVEIRTLIKQLAESCGVILSTHILPEVQATCDRVQIIKTGEIIYNSSIDELNSARSSSSLVIACENLPDLADFKIDDSITKVSIIDGNRVSIHYQGENPAIRLAQLAVDKNWGLFELAPQKTSLEDIFVQLTQENHDV